MSLAAAACVMVIVGLAFVRSPPDASAPRGDVIAAADLSDTPDLRSVAGGRALVKANLQLSRNSEAQIRRALEQDPDSQSLRRLLQVRSEERRVGKEGVSTSKSRWSRYP